MAGGSTAGCLALHSWASRGQGAVGGTIKEGAVGWARNGTAGRLHYQRGKLSGIQRPTTAARPPSPSRLTWRFAPRWRGRPSWAAASTTRCSSAGGRQPLGWVRWLVPACRGGHTQGLARCSHLRARRRRGRTGCQPAAAATNQPTDRPTPNSASTRLEQGVGWEEDQQAVRDDAAEVDQRHAQVGPVGWGQ